MQRRIAHTKKNRDDLLIIWASKQRKLIERENGWRHVIFKRCAFTN